VQKVEEELAGVQNRVIIEGSAQDGELLGILKGFEVVAAGVGGGRERRRLRRAQIFFQKV
jgi:hypothetical protein